MRARPQHGVQHQCHGNADHRLHQPARHHGELVRRLGNTGFQRVDAKVEGPEAGDREQHKAAGNAREVRAIMALLSTPTRPKPMASMAPVEADPLVEAR
jgi:hypothetical protein